MYEIKNFTPREYQTSILATARNSNTLACLPTGTGKTKLAIMLLVERLNNYNESKAIIISPTKPLSSQITKEIEECTNIPASKLTLLTGAISPKERAELFQNAQVIVATPQTIQFDVENNRISLEDTSILIVDECHRSKEKFANTQVARYYNEQAKNKLILALTASPGATKEKVTQVCSNLFIKNIELRTEEDADMAEHIQDKISLNVKVALPQELKKIQEILKNHYKSKVSNLVKYGITKPSYAINKSDLLKYQFMFQKQIKSGNFMAYRAISDIAEAIKVSHAVGLIETQTPKALHEYFIKLGQKSSKASKNLLNNKLVANAVKLTENLVNNNIKHPKMAKLKDILNEEFSKNPSMKAIIFANYRSTVNEIKQELAEVTNASPITLVGQKDGLTQKEQIETIEQFNKGLHNILICTSIGEEGLSIGSLDIAIFYDHTASEIRKIQRSGRVARIRPGKIINLIAEKTLDEAMLWTAKRKEVKMHNLLNYMKRNLAK